MGLTRRINNVAERLGYYIGRLPPPSDSLSAHVAQVLDHFGVRHVLDVGAHFGEYALGLRRAGYRGDITSFEPVSESFERLAAEAASDRHWRVENMALGVLDGELDIWVYPASQLSSFLGASDRGRQTFGNKLTTARRETVTVRSLDSWAGSAHIGKAHDPVYLKLDTQGYNLKVVEGASSFLERVVALQCEMALRPIYEGVPDWQEDLLTFKRLGFVPSAMFPVAVDRHFRALEIDCVMVREATAEGIRQTSGVHEVR